MELISTVTAAPDAYFPVVNEQGKMTGILSINDIREVLFEESLSHLIVAKDLAPPKVVRVFWHETLQYALKKMAAMQLDELPVVREDDEMVAMSSKTGYYHSRSEA